MMENRVRCPALLSPRMVPPAYWLTPATTRGNRARTTAAVVMSAPRPESDADGGQHDVDREERDHAEHQRLVDGDADTFGTALGGQAAIAADQSRDRPEDRSLDGRDEDFG